MEVTLTARIGSFCAPAPGAPRSITRMLRPGTVRPLYEPGAREPSRVANSSDGDHRLVVRIGEHDLVEAAVDGEAVGEVPRIGRGVGARRAAVAAGRERLLLHQRAASLDFDGRSHHDAGKRGGEIDGRRRPSVDVEIESAILGLLVEHEDRADERIGGAIGDDDRPTDVVDPGRRHARAEPCLGQTLFGWRRRHPPHGGRAEDGALGSQGLTRHHDRAGDRQQDDQQQRNPALRHGCGASGRAPSPSLSPAPAAGLAVPASLVVDARHEPGEIELVRRSGGRRAGSPKAEWCHGRGRGAGGGGVLGRVATGAGCAPPCCRLTGPPVHSAPADGSVIVPLVRVARPTRGRGRRRLRRTLRPPPIPAIRAPRRRHRPRSAAHR